MDWLQFIVSPVLMAIGGIITWFIKSKTEELRTLEEKLRQERKSVYINLLSPYIRLFAKPPQIKETLDEITSYEYRKTAFDFILFGSDEVVRAYNEFTNYVYQSESVRSMDSQELMRLWGKLLLEIRKSLGNKHTKLNEFDMLKGMIKDIEQIKS